MVQFENSFREVTLLMLGNTRRLWWGDKDQASAERMTDITSRTFAALIMAREPIDENIFDANATG